MKRQTFVLILISIVLLLLLTPIRLAIMILLDISDVSKLLPRSVSFLPITGSVLSAFIVGFLVKIVALEIYKEEKPARISFLVVFFIALFISMYIINVPSIGPSPQKVIYYTLYENEAYVNPYFGEISLPFKERDWTKEYGLRRSRDPKRKEGRLINATMLQQGNKAVYLECSDVMAYGRLILY
ncbi:hypothetical protein ADU37_CDS10360 [Thermococcus sp. 2319x1]|uniref:hypothetical protein n=1 Tax=Thermococcus sp. 2319x1 TaxID=1674923 RepID=UPI00073A8B27|nr:hypothetical protein [Thermococcus sp. 2319x1]ALV62735.1 hypothetical protein ADU37_CDS10360 [Thermococcus sp. 2319x1]